MAIFVEILSFILEEYFGWDDFEIADLWRTDPGRRRSIIRQIGSSLPSILPRLYTKRSIIRSIGSRMPLPPIKRPHFQAEIKPIEYTNLQDGDIDWIMGPEYYDDTTSSIDTDDRENLDGFLLIDDEINEKFMDTCDGDSPKKSIEPVRDATPDTHVAIDNTLAMKKITALEEELNRLRAQIASLVVVPPLCTPSFMLSGPMTSTPCTPGGPPPPPPPPPPPLEIATPVKSVIDIIKENRSRRRTTAGLPSDQHSNIPDMSDVLKGLGSVKLKSIQRSPGGTPVRSKPLETEGSDPASIIARALKKKFAQRRKLQDADSPSLDKENQSSFSLSPSNSPKIPQFGPHLLKSSKRQRKSGTDFKPLQCSPLANVNV